MGKPESDSDKPPSAGRATKAAPTIRDVATAAGVSIGSVSKALNNSGSLKQETRQHIIEVANALGFRPNDLAQALHRGQSFTVGLVSNDSFGRFTMPIMEGLENVLAEERIAVFMCNATDDPGRERQHLEQLLSKRVDGIVFTARRSDRRPSVSVDLGTLPTVFVFSKGDRPDSFCLLPDDQGGAELATEHLIERGYREIAHVSGPERFEAVRIRHAGYLQALASAGLVAKPEWFMTGPWSEQWGRDAVDRLFADRNRSPDAIFCGNDQIARGAVDRLRDHGIKVPEQVGVVGFDNWDVMATAAQPPLTSIDMNLYALGQEAGRRILRMIGGQSFEGVVRLPCTLVERASTQKFNPGFPEGEE